eukprot:m.110095 g.110095  ORF g.110095 m.110095 type:complete len:284 (+) comp51792_c1_seq1:668-1519(+)
MLAKESVKLRLDSPAGISFIEFSYQLFQAYDFLHLFQKHGCLVQIGGSDQWGNITAGTELIRKATGQQAFGVTLPLLTTAGGEKLGKSAGNAVWLAPELTSSYQLYQYFLQTTDADVKRYLNLFTFLSAAEVEAVMATQSRSPELRHAQHTLASHVTQLVHGVDGLLAARRTTDVLFGKTSITSLQPQELAAALNAAPHLELPYSLLDASSQNYSVAEAIVAGKLCFSLESARRNIANKGIYVNNIRVEAEEQVFRASDILAGDFTLLRRGKRSHLLVKWKRS